MARRKKKKNKSALYAAIAIIFLMVTSMIGLMYGDSASEVKKYDDVKLKATQVGWTTEIDDMQLIFQYLPESTKDLVLTPEIKNKLVESKVLYLTSSLNDPKKENIGVSQYYLSQTLPKLKNSFVQLAFTDHSTQFIQQIECENASLTTPVLLMKEGEKTQIKIENDCIIFEGAYAGDFLRFAEKLIFESIGIDTSKEYGE